MSVKVMTEDFIRKAREVHGDKFDYSLVEYIKARKKVKIICPVHGVFEQTPNGHLSGYGCNRCAQEESGRLRSLTKETFLEKAYAKFGDKFTYHFDLDITFSAQYPVRITCPTHGDFILKATHFLKNKCGCGDCGNASLPIKSDFEYFLKQSIEVHGDKYDYSKVNYKDYKTNVILICPTHGEFLVSPYRHYGVSKVGCIKCKRDKEAYEKLDKFKTEASITHNNNYDYTLITKWENCDTKVAIKCPIHGVFYQTPYQHHNMGQGCPKCANENARVIPTERYKDVQTLFYSFKYKGVYKIGITIKSLYERYSGEANFSNFTEIQEFIFPSYLDAFIFEQLLLDKYREFRYRGKKIFKKTGITECFTKDIVTLFLEEGGDIGS